MQPRRLQRLLPFALLVVVLASSGSATAGFTNGGFETGTLSGWTLTSSWPPAASSASGSSAGQIWSRAVAPTFLHDGSYGLRMLCSESDSKHEECRIGVAQTIQEACGFSAWIKLSGQTAYASSDLIVRIVDNNWRRLTYFFNSSPNYDYDITAGHRSVTAVTPNAWTFRDFDIVGDLWAYSTANLAPPYTVTFEMATRNGDVRVDLDTVVVTSKCVPPTPPPPPGPPPPVLTNQTLTNTCGRTFEVWVGHIAYYDVGAISYVPPPYDWVTLHHTPAYPNENFLRPVIPGSTQNPARGTVNEHIRIAPLPNDAGTHTFTYHGEDQLQRVTQNCTVTIVVKKQPPVWVTPPTQCGTRVTVDPGDYVRFDVKARGINIPVHLTHTNLPRTTPEGGAWTHRVAGGQLNGWNANGTFHWQTNEFDAGKTHEIRWRANDAVGQYASPLDCRFTIEVGCLPLVLNGCLQLNVVPLLGLLVLPASLLVRLRREGGR